VWYQWQAPTSASVTFTTAGSNYDTVLAVYTGTAVNNLVTIGQNDDVNPGIVQSSTLTFNAVAGTIYKIAVDGFNDGGAFLYRNPRSCSNSQDQRSIRPRPSILCSGPEIRSRWLTAAIYFSLERIETRGL
jgi:hypothetical protein